MIKIFRGRHGFLSNFYHSPIEMDGILYLTAENAYQAGKTDSTTDKVLIAGFDPAHAKRYGRGVQIIEGLDRLELMAKVLASKFEQNRWLRQQLLQTEDEQLMEGNTWNDTYWGVDLNTLEGQNHLGKLLMAIRTNYRMEN